MGEPGTEATGTDASIIAASLAVPESFGSIFDRHFSDVHRYLERRVGGDVADMLAAEVFTIAFRRRQLYVDLHPTARPWLFGIATNLVFRDRRRERRRLRALARMASSAGDRGEGTDRLGDGVAERVDADVTWRRLGPALAALADRDRDVVLLVAWEGLSYAEVATALDIPIGTVRSRLHRARATLRELLGVGELLGVDGHDPMTIHTERLGGGSP